MSLGNTISLFIILILIVGIISMKVYYDKKITKYEDEKPKKYVAITLEKFKSYIDTHGFNVADAKTRFSSDSTFAKGLKAGYLTEKNDKEGFRINYFEFNDESHTMLSYYDAIVDTEASNNGEFSENSENGLNYSKYTAYSNGYYIIMIRIDNTLIYATVDKDNKQMADNSLSELGYK